MWRAVSGISAGSLSACTARRASGYISYSPVYGSRPGWMHDLSRRQPDSKWFLKLVGFVLLVLLRGNPGGRHLTEYMPDGEGANGRANRPRRDDDPQATPHRRMP